MHRLCCEMHSSAFGKPRARVSLELWRSCAPAQGAGSSVTVSFPPARKVNSAKEKQNPFSLQHFFTLTIIYLILNSKILYKRCTLII